MNGKGLVADWLRSQTSTASNDGLTWTIVETRAYTEMLACVYLLLIIVFTIYSYRDKGSV
jgi:hypothetical protein